MSSQIILKGRPAALILLALLFFLSSIPNARAQERRTLSGIVVNNQNESASGVLLIVSSATGERKTVTDERGNFSLLVPGSAFTVRIEGKYVVAQPRDFSAGEATENIRLEIRFVVPQVHESLVINASQLDPAIDRRNDTVYKNSLFSRDDQLFHTLAAGINAGQHEGGGKSVEVRRFGFNLDRGGVSGGLKVLVDNVQQNQGTQGHGQGYLGQLKSLTAELVEDVNILNGPFSAEYGDFSGLGVVHIRLKESLPDQLTLRLQGGSFATFRAFAAYSPQLKAADALLAFETSSTDGPLHCQPGCARRCPATGGGEDIDHRFLSGRFGPSFQTLLGERGSVCNRPLERTGVYNG
jgi:hypothetical protein